MGYDTTASDWEVAGLGAISGGTGVAGGYFIFVFKSKSADVACVCRYGGIGFGGGLDLGKIVDEAKLLGKAFTVGAEAEKAARAAKAATGATKLAKTLDVLSYASASTSISYGAIVTETPFSMFDLHGMPGRLTYGSVSPGYGYTLMFITAMTGVTTNLFASQPAHGWGLGAGVAGMSTVGVWFNRENS